MKGHIRWRYKKVITVDSADRWSKSVFQATHREYYIQTQQFDPAGTCKTYTELKAILKDSIAFEYLVSTAAMGYLKELNHAVPDIIDALGESCLTFKEFKFELLESHMEQKELHRVAVSFFSDWLLWVDTIGDQILCAKEIGGEDFTSTQETFMIPTQKHLQIAYYRPYEK